MGLIQRLFGRFHKQPEKQKTIPWTPQPAKTIEIISNPQAHNRRGFALRKHIQHQKNGCFGKAGCNYTVAP